MFKKNINQSTVNSTFTPPSVVANAVAQQAAFAAKFSQSGALVNAITQQTAFVAKSMQQGVVANAIAQQAAFAASFSQSGALVNAITQQAAFVAKSMQQGVVANAIAQQAAFAAKFSQPDALVNAITQQAAFVVKSMQQGVVANVVAQQAAFINIISQNMTFSEQLTYGVTLQDILVSVTPDQYDNSGQHQNFSSDEVNKSKGNGVQEILKGDIQLSSQEEQELNETLKEVSEQKANWEQNLVARLKKYKESHPVIYGVLVFILGTVLVPIIVNYCSNLISLKSEPSSKAEIVIVVPANKVRIINVSQNYYYQVEYFDEEAQEFQTAWIGKGKLNTTMAKQNSVSLKN